MEENIKKLNTPSTHAYVHGIKATHDDLEPLIKPKWFTDLTVEILLNDVIVQHKVENSYNVVSATTYLTWKVSITTALL